MTSPAPPAAGRTALSLWWFNAAPLAEHVSRSATSQMHYAIHGASDADALWAVAARPFRESDAAPAEWEPAQVALLEILVTTVSDLGHRVPATLARQVPRQVDPVPEAFGHSDVVPLRAPDGWTVARRVPFGDTQVLICLLGAQLTVLVCPAGSVPAVHALA